MKTESHSDHKTEQDQENKTESTNSIDVDGNNVNTTVINDEKEPSSLKKVHKFINYSIKLGTYPCIQNTTSFT